ncbi:uncharacterized protein LOC119733242 [Patiria miniata]|uniref:Tyr recombinase domain-containing protein n=1 Tax=Patiria miniata TaxID=46514 RepID=A0A914AGV9_PATMI|nr:uncharacterized protein LOC119733242 [Patiria miniata]
MPHIRERLASTGISNRTSEIIVASWRSKTQKQYASYLRRWDSFCSQHGINPIKPTIGNALQFLTDLFDGGLSYSSVNSARSAISSIILPIDGVTFGSHALTTRFMKGVFNCRPSFPRYKTIWDVGVLLNFLKSLGSTNELSLKLLSKKVVTLLALVTAQRIQTLHLICIDDVLISDKECHLRIGSLLKQSRPGVHQADLVLPIFSENPDLCIVTNLSEYIKRTSIVRGEEKVLFISFQKPFKALSRDSISRWIKDMLKSAGIDTSVFTAHSVRSASTSAAATAGVPIQLILQTAGWSGAQTFAKFYNKPIIEKPAFSTSVLNKNR